jgi:predicted metal-binding protein
MADEKILALERGDHKERPTHVEEHTVTIGVDEFIQRFRNEEVVGGYCRECENYGRSWGCPPFDFDVEERLRQYNNVLLIATKITPQKQGLPISAAQELLIPERKRIDKRLLELEQEHNGLACSYVGKCYYCGDESCMRTCGLPCRLPDKVRPSLEAYGFDVSRISRELLGIELQWGKDGLLPRHLVIVCALLYRGTEKIIQIK